MDLTLFRKILGSQARSIPLVIDESSLVDLLNQTFHHDITTLDECRTGNLENIYLFEKEEGKTYMSVKIIRFFIENLAEKPYQGKNIYILRNFDASTPEAMNASLKSLEEPPEHALILLVVKNPENLLDTIRSRTLNFFQGELSVPLSPEIALALKGFLSGNIGGLIELQQSGKLDEMSIFHVLFILYKNSPSIHCQRIENCIIDLLETHENPRNILDRALLYL